MLTNTLEQTHTYTITPTYTHKITDTHTHKHTQTHTNTHIRTHTHLLVQLKGVMFMNFIEASVSGYSKSDIKDSSISGETKDNSSSVWLFCVLVED